MQEIIAIIGSFSGPHDRYTPIVLYPPHITPYLAEELRRKGVTEIPENVFMGMVDLVNAIVYKSTHSNPRFPNDKITRKIMKCDSLQELADTCPEYFM